VTLTGFPITGRPSADVIDSGARKMSVAGGAWAACAPAFRTPYTVSIKVTIEQRISILRDGVTFIPAR
jgi:hypothetical protein